MNLYELPLRTLKLKKSLNTVLENNGYLTIRSLLDAGEEKVLTCKGLGTVSKNDLRKVFSRLKNNSEGYILMKLIPDCHDLKAYGITDNSLKYLKEAGIERVEDIVFMEEETVKSFRYNVERNIQYVRDSLKYLYVNTYQWFQGLQENDELLKQTMTSLLNALGVEINDIPGLSDNTVLQNAGYTKLGEFLALSEEELMTIPGMTDEMSVEIGTAMGTYVNNNTVLMYVANRIFNQDDDIFDLAEKPENRESVITYAKKYCLYEFELNGKEYSHISEAFPSLEDLIASDQNSLNDLIFRYDENTYRAAFAKRCAYLLEHEERMKKYLAGDTDALFSNAEVVLKIMDTAGHYPFNPLPVWMFKNEMPGVSEDRIIKAADELCRVGKLSKDQNGRYELVYPVFGEVCYEIDGFEKGEKLRLMKTENGYEYVSVGSKKITSPEEIRGIVSDTYFLKRIFRTNEFTGIYFEEDRYGYLLTTYDIDPQDVVEYCGAPVSLPAYADARRFPRGTKPVSSALLDMHLPDTIKDGLQRMLIKGSQS